MKKENVQDIRIADYTYDLPHDRIAEHPLPERDASKLLVFRDGDISEHTYRNIASLLPAGSLIVFNNTRVIEARILFQKSTGAVIEIFCLEPHEKYPDVVHAMTQQGSVLWKCLIGGASKWKHGMVLQKEIDHNGNATTLGASIVERREDCFVIEFKWQPSSMPFASVLHEAGIIPLPPYIKRASEESDRERYQTVFAKEDGSVAAPTAGLHFTPRILSDLQERNIESAYVTLHVGAGTFKPVKTETIGEHHMHSEYIHVDVATIEQLISHAGKNIIAVGTTSLRTLESLYWLGVKLSTNPDIQPQELHVGQWDPYELEKKAEQVSANAALNALKSFLSSHHLDAVSTKTELMIVPGYKLRVANILVTNFHQPQSTLLLLVAAVAGEKWRNMYEYALSHEFRFLSYGDGCVIFQVKS